MENSLLAIFDELPCTIVQGLWPDFGATLKICKKIPKLLHSISTCICIRKRKNSFLDGHLSIVDMLDTPNVSDHWHSYTPACRAWVSDFRSN